MPRALKVCSTSGCPELTSSGRCDACRHAADRGRGTAAERGYGHRWSARIRPAFLRRHPLCTLCGVPATDVDHWPIDRRTLVGMGVRNPDADERMRALCSECHKRATALAQPGGWNAP